MKTIIRKFDVKRFRMAAIKLTIAACTLAMMCSTAMVTFADNENAAPDGVKTGTMSTLVGVVFWIIRIAILIIGGGPSLIKIVQGQTDENPRDRNAGIVGLVVTGAAFAATFVVQGLI